MKYTKNSRPGDCSTRTATETAAFGEAAVPCEDSITSGGGGQIQIANLLMHGAENAIPLRHLKEMTGLPGRDLRRQIERERRRGVPILADCKSGYFLPDDEGEKARCVQSMRGRAREILKTAAAIEKGEITQSE